jgi:hypothetical protein
MAEVKVFDFEFDTTGLSDREAKELKSLQTTSQDKLAKLEKPGEAQISSSNQTPNISKNPNALFTTRAPHSNTIEVFNHQNNQPPPRKN